MAKIKAGLSGATVVTPIVRLSYPALFEARRDNDNPAKKAKFQASLLFPKDPAATYARLGLAPDMAAQYDAQLKAVKAEIMKLAVEAYGGADKLPEEIRSQDLRKNTPWPFRDQAQKDGEGYEPGALFINVSSERKPQVVDQAMRRILTQEDPLRGELGRERKLSPKSVEDVYPGCWVRVSVRPFSYENSGNSGISLGLGNVQLIADDTPLGGGGGNADTEFAPIGGGAAMTDELAELLG